jgi:transglutaminase-like putative cysteine protease
VNFERIFIAVSYSLVGVAFIAVTSSGEIGWIGPSAFAVCFVISAFRRTDGPAKVRTARLWTAFLVVALAALVLVASNDDNWLLHSLEFALLMTVSRLFQRRFAKDYLQLLVLTFLLMLVAAVIHPSLTFAVCFLIYTVLAIWGLTMVHLARQIEVQTRTGPEHLLPRPETTRSWWRPWRTVATKAPKSVADPLPHAPISAETMRWRQRQLIGGRFLLASSVMAVVVLLISMVFFFLFPRLGMGFFFAQTRGSQSMVGFSDQIELGQFGKLKSSSQVVMRVQFPDDPGRLQAPVRIRGLSFDRWQGKGWTRLTDPQWELLHRGPRYLIPTTRRAHPRLERVVHGRIYLEPLDSDLKVLFAPPRTRWVEFLDSQYDSLRGRRKLIRQSVSGDLTYKAPYGTSLGYAVASVEPVDAEARLKLLSLRQGTTPRWIHDRWAELPAGIDPRIGTLSRRLAGGQATVFGQAAAIERGLREGWTYSLEGDQDAEAPLMDFLFGNKRGHCEYFATSMALMMRTLGHPARVVNGFYGGEFNGFGGYRMIRQGDAHSWVEVFVPGSGWRTFEPTPPSGQMAPTSSGFLATARRVVDGASMLWYTWVVEYDLERQVAVFRGAARTLRQFGKWLRSDGKRSNSDLGERQIKGDWSAVGRWVKMVLPWVFGLALIGWLALSWFRRARVKDRSGRFDRRLERATKRLEQQLRRAGWPRRPWQTWHAVAGYMGVHGDDVVEPISRFASAYDRARYAVDRDELSLRSALDRVVEAEHAVKRWRRSQGRAPPSTDRAGEPSMAR